MRLSVKATCQASSAPVQLWQSCQSTNKLFDFFFFQAAQLYEVCRFLLKK